MSVTYIGTALRQLVRQRAGGRCEYCGLPEDEAITRHQIDHVIAEQHGGATDADNLALACLLCNQLKGPNIGSLDPLTAAFVPLFHPRLDRWADHFEWDTSGMIVPRSPSGRATVALLQLNRPNRIIERQYLPPP